MSWEAWGDPPEPDEPKPCPDCTNGKVKVWRNAKGEIDYMDGAPTEEEADCDTCKGEGEIWRDRSKDHFDDDVI